MEARIWSRNRDSGDGGGRVLPGARTENKGPARIVCDVQTANISASRGTPSVKKSAVRPFSIEFDPIGCQALEEIHLTRHNNLPNAGAGHRCIGLHLPKKHRPNGALETRLWAAADQLRANSGLTSAQYSTPVLGLIFLRFAEVRFAARRAALEKGRRLIAPRHLARR